MSNFDAAVRRWDVGIWLRRQGFQLRFTESGQVVIKCPHCHDHKQRLYISISRKLCICFNCDWKGNAVALVKMITGCDTFAALDIIYGGERAAVYAQEPERAEMPKAVQLPDGFRLLKAAPDARSQPYWSYLADRGLAPSLVLKYQIGYCHIGAYHHRIVIPIYMEGALRSWVARAVGKAQRKYLTPTGSHMRDCLFNYDQMIGQSEVVLVEGVFDALRLPQRAIATMGNKISTYQVDLLTAAGFERVILCYDADARRQSLRYASRLPEYVEVLVAELPKGCDPGSAPSLVLDRALREAHSVRYSDYAGEGPSGR